MIVRAQAEGVKAVRIHALLDGRDVPETSALDYVEPFEAFLAEISGAGFDAQIASGGGRMNITMDRYAAIVVMLVIPVVLLMTIFAAWVMKYTIDRVSLFALIFSIGILVDDAIVVVENIYRRWLEVGRTDDDTAVDAVREVGNPTILATFTVVAALLPMGFVSGMMGPYMEPIPALGSVAMAISLFAAFVFTPYLAVSKWLRPSMTYLETAEKREHHEAEKLEKVFRKVLSPADRELPQALHLPRRAVGDLPLYLRLLLLQVGPGEDAAAGQQAGVLGGARHAGGYRPSGHRQPGPPHGGETAHPARGHRHPALRRDGPPLRLQRYGAALLPALRSLAGRTPGPVGAQEEAASLQSRPGGRGPRDAQGRDRRHRGHASRWWRCPRVRRSSNRWWPRSMAHRPRSAGSSPAT